LYKGGWRNCIKDGQGSLTYADGSCVTALFIDDQPEGKGVKSFPDGSVYKGMLSKGLFHGQGRYKQPADGSEYNGGWVRNEMRGQGIKKIRWGEVEISGIFYGNHVNGKGYKKWRKITYKTIKGSNPSRTREAKQEAFYIYRGQLQNS